MDHLTIENKAGKVKLNDVVDGYSIQKITEEIGKLFGASAHQNGQEFGEITNSLENGIDTLELEINSPGGSIFDGYNLYQEIMSLRDRGVEVTATVTGMAASMASVICMACNYVRMVPHARMMIHEASQVVMGNSEQIRKTADLLDSISNDIAVIYSNKSGKSVDDIREMMKKETWMTAQEATDLGFSNEVFDIRANKSNPKAMSILNILFPGNDKIAELEAQVLENDTLRAELSVAQDKITELSGLSSVVAEKDTEIANHLESLTAIKAEVTAKDEEINKIKAEIETLKASVPKEVVTVLASIGQDEPLKDDNGPVAGFHLAKFQSLKGAEATAYFKAHSKEIAADQKALKTI